MVGWVSGSNFGWEFWNGTQLRNEKYFWLETVKVKRSVKRMEMWLGVPKEDVTQSNGPVRDW